MAHGETTMIKTITCEIIKDGNAWMSFLMGERLVGVNGY